MIQGINLFPVGDKILSFIQICGDVAPKINPSLPWGRTAAIGTDFPARFTTLELVTIPIAVKEAHLRSDVLLMFRFPAKFHRLVCL